MSNERACHEFLKFECDSPIKAAKFFSNLGQLTKGRKVSAKSIENFLDNYFDWHPECSDNAIYFILMGPHRIVENKALLGKISSSILNHLLERLLQNPNTKPI